LPVTRRRSGTTNPYACASRALASRSDTNSISTRLATMPLVTEIRLHRLRDRRAQRQPTRQPNGEHTGYRERPTISDTNSTSDSPTVDDVGGKH
jgi:hypothetical protein